MPEPKFNISPQTITVPHADAVAEATALHTISLIQEGMKEAVEAINKASYKGLYTTTLYYGNSMEVVKAIADRLRGYGYGADARCISGVHCVDIGWAKSNY